VDQQTHPSMENLAPSEIDVRRARDMIQSVRTHEAGADRLEETVSMWIAESERVTAQSSRPVRGPGTTGTIDVELPMPIQRRIRRDKRLILFSV